MSIVIDGTGSISGVSATGLTTAQTVTSSAIDAGAVTPAKLSQPLTLGTAVASTSGTNITFTNIPSWVKRITIMLAGVSTTGSNSLLVQLGTSGGLVTSGYQGSASYISTAVAGVNMSTGFMIEYGTAAANIANGIVTITNITGNQWTESGMIGRSDGYTLHPSAGVVTLSGALTQVSVTSVGSTDTFDAGSINILYE